MKRFLLAVGAVLALGACGGGSTTYSTEVRDGFMSACMANGGTNSSCSCALENIEDEYSEREFRRAEARMVLNGADLPEGMVDAIADCAA